nr:PREDICTED: sphingosine-1-phosphate phosphatase 2-like [Linepithema humile]XP_012217515.1 PREDICTED: sphingosine-1-phosphate phosphatase 2-like [Linepithema humile]XP_012217516.1 PREDICTED: sphingosine-1-phosphate phosphatase 2-like [Linepithema humile]XP_012217517.1 PREDICTED: sphingosine-1-phosphate phosphatase 2-like [Linepithema humile]
MALELINYLKDPQLVASIQQFFGVKIHYYEHYENLKESKTSQNEDNKYISEKIDNYKKNHVFTCHSKEINGCDANNKQFNGCRQIEYSREKDESTKKREKETSMVLQNPHYTITNLFWYYLFLFGTELGDEIFYCAFIPFLFWNIDGALGRRVVLVWATVMSIGQILKDIIRWPRPACPPAVRLQNKWSQEYGMPSTHAMVGLTIPFSIVLFTMDKYIYPFSIGCTVAFIWCVLVSTSRLYLGMHTVLDIVAGLILATALMVPLVPLVEMTNVYIITNVWLLAILIAVSIATIVYYPCSDKWTPTRSDTAMVVSVTAGIHTGAWFSYYTGALSTSLFSPPYNIVWPTPFTLGHLILRTMLGFAGVIATKTLCKFLSYATMCAILGINWRELMKCQDYSGNQNKVFVDLVNKYVACFMIGVNTVYFLPQTFSTIGIERPTFRTEM